MADKMKWEGTIVAVQPRIRLSRSFDQQYHEYLGFMLVIDGVLSGEASEFTVGIGKAAQAKHQFRAGDTASGASVAVQDARRETVDLYKTSALRVLARSNSAQDSNGGPPWIGIPPPLDVYRERGHRRLATQTYTRACGTCLWASRMPVEITIDHWNPSKKRYRSETFCYGPLNCPKYRAGPPRKVPGRNGMTYVEEDWVDEDATSHRAPHE